MSGHMKPATLQRRSSRSSGSYPSCHSSRIEKTKSQHNSPRTSERRKTTTETKLYASLDDHFKMMFGMAPEEAAEERQQSARPMSWHPSSSQFQAPPQSTNYFEPAPQHWSQQYSDSPRDSPHGSDFYSLDARNSMFEPFPSAYPGNFGMHRGSDESDFSWQSAPQQHTPGYVHSAMNTPTTEPLPWYLQHWAQKTQGSLMSRNGSSDFLPIQHPAQHEQEMEEDNDEGENLVALGLYDAPEPSLTMGGLTEGTGKGLKLEETWQPPEEEEDDEDEEDEDADVAEDASSESSVEELSPPLPPMHQHAPHIQMPVHVKAQTPGSMEGQSFFFDDDEAVSKEWWGQQGKQPSMVVQDTRLAYGGWL